MIELTRLNGSLLTLNSDLIKWIETAPDTMLTLTNGEKVVVRESCAEVSERIFSRHTRLLAEALKLLAASGKYLESAVAAITALAVESRGPHQPATPHSSLKR